MGCAPSAIHQEKCELIKDDIILSDDLEMSEETCAHIINDTIRVNESVVNRKTLYKDEIDDLQEVQTQSIILKPILIKSCFKGNEKTQKNNLKEKKVRFCKSYQIIINGIKYIVIKKKQKKSQKLHKRIDETF